MSDRDSWQMARIASNRPLPKPRKMHGPVGVKHYVAGAELRIGPSGELDLRTDHQHDVVRDINSCGDCGYHVCSCKPQDPANPKQLYLNGQPLQMESCGCALLSHDKAMDAPKGRLCSLGWIEMTDRAGYRWPCAEHKPKPAQALHAARPSTCKICDGGKTFAFTEDGLYGTCQCGTHRYAEKLGIEYTQGEIDSHGTTYCQGCDRYTSRCTCAAVNEPKSVPTYSCGCDWKNGRVAAVCAEHKVQEHPTLAGHADGGWYDLARAHSVAVDTVLQSKFEQYADQALARCRGMDIGYAADTALLTQPYRNALITGITVRPEQEP